MEYLDDTIKYIYKNSQHKNPLCRVASIDSTNGVGGKRDSLITNIIIAIIAVTSGIIGGYLFEKLTD